MGTLRITISQNVPTVLDIYMASYFKYYFRGISNWETIWNWIARIL